MSKIKKYLDFFKKKEDINKIIPKEELEDQFLRLIEIFNCSFVLNDIRNSLGYSIQGCLISAKKDYVEVSEEINSIKYRMKHIYPNTELHIEKITTDLDLEKYTRGKVKKQEKLDFWKILINKT